MTTRAEKQREYRATKRGHLSACLGNVKTRAKEQNLSCDLTLDFLESIATDKCPVFGTLFSWGQGQHFTDESPSLDKIIPELGYMQYNVVFISFKANTIKQTVTETELYAVADWLHDERKKVLAYVAKNQPTSVSTTDHREGEVYPELGSFSATGTWEDNNDSNHNSGADARKDADSSTQESSGDSMGHRGSEVGTPMSFEGVENHGLSNAKIIWIRDRRGHIPNKP